VLINNDTYFFKGIIMPVCKIPRYAKNVSIPLAAYRRHRNHQISAGKFSAGNSSNVNFESEITETKEMMLWTTTTNPTVRIMANNVPCYLPPDMP